jgi:short-subunit dehydrogenase
VTLNKAHIILTGASGGLGSALAELLCRRGAELLLVGRRSMPLQNLQGRLVSKGGKAYSISADLGTEEGRRRVTRTASSRWGSIDILINNASVTEFAPFIETSNATIEQIITTNLLAPFLLARDCLPAMIERGNGRIVNIGSTFGSLGYPCFAAYCASKFGLRGFSEALRRELAGSGVGVTYIAPRTVRTTMNTTAVKRLAEATHMTMDEPEWAAAQIVRAIEMNRNNVQTGMAEIFLARLNALFPSLVDLILSRQYKMIHACARDGP